MRRLTGSSVAISLVVHLALAAIVLPATLGTRRVASWFGITLAPDRPAAAEERVRFVEAAEPRPVRVTNGRDDVSGGEAATPKAVTPPTDAPAEAPTEAAAVGSAMGTDERARGDGTGGPLTGIKPALEDARLLVVPWEPGAAPTRPTYEAVKSRIDSLIRVGAIPKAYEDSLARLYGQVVERAPGDWTMRGRNGERYGIDGGFIRLGKVSIPTVLLALLPLNSGQMNVQQYYKQREIGAMSAEIRYQAQRAMNEDEFRDAVRRVRLRKEREREEERKRREGPGVIPVQP